MLLAAVSQAAEDTFRIHDILRAVSGALEVPVVVLLVVFLLAAAALVGWLIAEYCTERRHLKVALPSLMEQLRTADDREGVIEESGLLRRQKDALLELLRHPDFTDATREALAVELLEREQDRYDNIIKLSELLARLAPMLGLLGTLIPLGPGIIALGQGDTYTLSTSLLTAFDTTIAGLVAAAFAIVVSSVRRRWYREYASTLEALYRGSGADEEGGRRMTRLSGKSLRSRHDDAPVNPMDSVSNLADAMLVLAVGIMLALIINWNVDISGAKTAQEEQTDPSISFAQDDLTESQDDAGTIEGDLTEMGKVYYDQETGTYYIVTNPKTEE